VHLYDLINISLTPNRYHLAVQNYPQPSEQIRTGKKTGIWLALAVALGLHAVILLLPLNRQVPNSEYVQVPIELQLTAFSPPEPVQIAELPAPVAQPLPAPEPKPELMPEHLESVVDTQPETEQPLLTPIPLLRDFELDLKNLSEQEKSQLTNTILSRQFISEESAADQLFGRLLEQHSSELQREFHYPVREDMISMLNQPMPDLPFAYTPGLINFAYDPGVKGDLQRFWDVITPEFGWRTDNGTEFKCIWVLIIAGCGWK
jgi:hypothetical protein